MRRAHCALSLEGFAVSGAAGFRGAFSRSTSLGFADGAAGFQGGDRVTLMLDPGALQPRKKKFSFRMILLITVVAGMLLGIGGSLCGDRP